MNYDDWKQNDGYKESFISVQLHKDQLPRKFESYSDFDSWLVESDLILGKLDILNCESETVGEIYSWKNIPELEKYEDGDEDE
jgi:hypothetical protein